jgi:ubiquinone/menaquinone biosynthesis C-methylase UbiE
MNEFDIKAAGWDKDPMHWDRSVAIINQVKQLIPLNRQMTALEYGAGTGIASFLLKDDLKDITLMDNSSEMLRITDEKIKTSGVKNLKTLNFDLEQENYKEKRFDLIFTQLVLHHVTDIESIISKFYYLLNPGGHLAIAELYTEDGSFHGKEFTGHKGFDPVELSKLVSIPGFKNISYRKCYVLNRKISDTETKQFDVFLLIATRDALNQ